MGHQDEGLYHKFYVARVDGRDQEGRDKENARYFVLDYANDPYAIPALRVYIEAAQEKYPQLAIELQHLIDEYE